MYIISRQANLAQSSSLESFSIFFLVLWMIWLDHCSIIGIQIMFDEERNHWIATHHQNHKVKVYDSCFSGSLSPSIQEMLVCFYRPAVRDNSLVVTVMPNVQQRGSADCGLFAIGTAFQAASGLSCDLQQEELKQHLKENFDSGILTPFPTTTAGKKANENIL